MSPVCGSHQHTCIASNMLVGSSSTHEPLCHKYWFCARRKLNTIHLTSRKYDYIEINQFITSSTGLRPHNLTGGPLVYICYNF